MTAIQGATKTEKEYGWIPGRENSAGAIVFRNESGRLLYLVLHYEEGHWGAPKGHREDDESPGETARREIREETGLEQVRIKEGFCEQISYSFQGSDGTVRKSVIYFLAETGFSAVRLSAEHVDFCWMPLEEALERITYADEKAVLQKAAGYLAAGGLRERGSES
ncbi:MAG: NUDIX domain-containing protein [Dehalococcoidales bacterium]|nr:NUDIX domain-containing protein [Dehalococcoidales bacterium]